MGGRTAEVWSWVAVGAGCQRLLSVKKIISIKAYQRLARHTAFIRQGEIDGSLIDTAINLRLWKRNADENLAVFLRR
jgi:hypothetical protein